MSNSRYKNMLTLISSTYPVFDFHKAINFDFHKAIITAEEMLL